MATQLLKTVMPSGGDYTSLEACMNANEQNLVTADKYFDVEIDGTWSSADTTAVTIHNYTTDATRYINIYTTSAARHNGKAAAVSGLSNYRISVSTNNSILIDIFSNYVTINGIEGFGSATYSRDGIRIEANVIYIVIKNNIIHDRVCYYGGIMSAYGDDENYIYNNIVYKIANNPDTNSGSGIHITQDNTETAYIYNNTCYGNAKYGINTSGNAVVMKNNISNANVTADYNGTFGTSADNIASDTTSPDNEWDSKTVTFVSVVAGSQDFHLASDDTSGAIDGGTDLSATFTDDIDGVTRTGTWDIGADEYVAAAGGAYSQLIMIGE
jgi:hypothetical protein